MLTISRRDVSASSVREDPNSIPIGPVHVNRLSQRLLEHAPDSGSFFQWQNDEWHVYYDLMS